MQAGNDPSVGITGFDIERHPFSVPSGKIVTYQVTNDIIRPLIRVSQGTVASERLVLLPREIICQYG